MALGITGIHDMDQHFTVEEVGPGEFGVAIRQSNDAIVMIRLRDPSQANAEELANLLGEKASAVITPSVVQAMLEGTMTETWIRSATKMARGVRWSNVDRLSSAPRRPETEAIAERQVRYDQC